MSIPGMGNDFQLFQPPQSSERRISEGDPMSFPQSTGDDLGQDWSQWMRWDEETFPETAKDPPHSPFAIRFTSPSTSAGQQESVSPQIEFSPHISLDNIIPPFESFLGADRNGTVVSETKSAAEGGIQSGKSTTSSPPISSAGASRKRKSGSQDDASTVTNLVQDGKKVPSKKRAHNIIEKRYRANLNEKIAELRDSVPSLRASKDANGDLLDDDEAEGVTSSSKLNKASILSKATEYIRHLEMRNKRLEEENTALKNRLRQVDKAADQTVTSAASISSPSTCTVSTESGASSSPSVFSQTEDPPSDPSSSSLYPPEGLIKVPESFKRMRSTPVRDTSYSQSYIQYQSNDSDSRESGGGRRRTYFPNKYMLGALAGLMVLEGMGTEKKTESTEKGLLAIPINLLKKVQLPSHVFWERSFVRSFWYSWHAHAISHFLILAVLILGSAFGVFVYLFNAEPRCQYSSSKMASVSDATFLSPSNFRRQAWLTSMQRVGVPRHVFFHEWYVVTSRCFEYVLRCLLGWKLYSWATGIAEEDDKGRVKTWDIAIDAQLAGGDAEISKSRLVLTIFASGTLPRSPRRMMLKALHLRILLWRVGVPGSWSFQISNNVARRLARYQWDLARKISRKLPKDHSDALPGYLAALLKFDSEDVMIDSIMQRAANLTWNRPSHEGTDDDEALLDIVEEDPAIQSSLDALAAWWSSHLLQRALLKYFEASSGGPDMKKSRDLFKSRIKIALDVAPQPSAAHTRALVMKAVFFEQDRVANIGTVLAALPTESGENEGKKASNFLDSSLPMSVRKEISVAVRCAMIATIFTAHATGDTSLPAIFSVQRAIAWFNKISLDPVELTLLEFAAVYHLLRVMASDTDFLTFSDSSSPSSPVLNASDLCSAGSSDGEKEGPQCSSQSKEDLTQPIPNLGRVASELIYWARNAYNPAFYGFTASLVRVIETECKSLCQRVGVDIVDSSCAQEERSRAKRLENTKTKRSSTQSREPANKDKNEAIQSISVPCLSPENCSDDDIGDRSPKPGGSNTPTDKVPNLAQAAS